MMPVLMRYPLSKWSSFHQSLQEQVQATIPVPSVSPSHAGLLDPIPLSSLGTEFLSYLLNLIYLSSSITLGSPWGFFYYFLIILHLIPLASHPNWMVKTPGNFFTTCRNSVNCCNNGGGGSWGQTQHVGGAEVTKASHSTGSYQQEWSHIPVISKCPSRYHEGKKHASHDLSLEPNSFNNKHKIYFVLECLGSWVS